MQQTYKNKIKQFLALVIKLSIVIGCVYFTYMKLTENDQLTSTLFLSNLTQSNIFTLRNGIFLLLLSAMNWCLEISKWHLLANQITKTSLKEAAIQSLTSHTSSLITPNRIGEYGAKALYFRKRNRKKAVLMNLIGNMHQLASTLFFGVIGAGYMYAQQNTTIELPKGSSPGIILLLILLLLLGFNFSSFGKLQFKKLKEMIAVIPQSVSRNIALLSAMRYLVFSHQFYFLLILFRADIVYINAITGVFSMYLIASAIPMLSMFDVVLKSTVAIWVFSFYFVDETSIAAIAMCMWILNFVLPSMMGSYFVLTFNSAKLINYKK